MKKKCRRDHFVYVSVRRFVEASILALTLFEPLRSAAAQPQYRLIEDRNTKVCSAVKSAITPAITFYMTFPYSERPLFTRVTKNSFKYQRHGQKRSSLATLADLNHDEQLELVLWKSVIYKPTPDENLIDTSLEILPASAVDKAWISKVNDLREILPIKMIGSQDLSLTLLKRQYRSGTFGNPSMDVARIKSGREYTRVNHFDLLQVEGQTYLFMQTQAWGYDLDLRDPRRKWAIVGKVLSLTAEPKAHLAGHAPEYAEIMLQDQMEHLCYFVLATK